MLGQSSVMSKHSGEKGKRENVLFRQILWSRAYEWCLACQRLISKNLVNQAFSKLAVGSNPRTSLLLSNKFKHFFWFSFISGTVGSKRKASRTASSKEHECVTLSCSRQTRQNKASLINQLERNVHVVKVGRTRTPDC